MKKIITFLFLSLYTLLTVYADIDYNVNKYGVMFVNFVVEDGKPTIDLFKNIDKIKGYVTLWRFLFHLSCLHFLKRLY